MKQKNISIATNYVKEQFYNNKKLNKQEILVFMKNKNIATDEMMAGISKADEFLQKITKVVGGLKGAIGIRAIAKAVSVTGLKKSDGTLKKGYKYQKQANGKTKVVKVIKKPVAKKKKVVKKTKKC